MAVMTFHAGDAGILKYRWIREHVEQEHGAHIFEIPELERYLAQASFGDFQPETYGSLLMFSLKGTVVAGDPEQHGGRDQTVRYIDYDHPERNDFLVINQFRVDPLGYGAPKQKSPGCAPWVVESAGPAPRCEEKPDLHAGVGRCRLRHRVAGTVRLPPPGTDAACHFRVHGLSHHDHPISCSFNVPSSA